MKFDWTISFGTVLHLLGLVAVIVGSFYKMRGEIEKELGAIREEFGKRLAVMESRVEDLWESWKKNGD